MLALLLSGCVPSVLPLYEAARDAALAEPGPPPNAWQPDAVLQLSAPLVEDLVRAAVRQQGPLSQKLDIGVAKVTPELRLVSLSVVPSRPCDGGCIGLAASFEGSLAWTLGPVQGATPMSAHGALDAVFEVAQERDELVVRAVPRHLRDLEVQLGDLDATIKGIKKSVRTFVEEQALAGVPPQVVARFPKGKLPIRAGRVAGGDGEHASGAAVRIELLTDVPEPGRAAQGADPTTGFAVAFAPSTLLQLARAEAFRHGPVGYGVVPEPTALSFGAGTFELGLRLWRIDGQTWWRDYQVRGTTRVVDGRLKLAPTDVVEGEKSKGAALADPLAALAEGFILKAIEDAVQTSLPLATQSKIGTTPVSVALDALAPAGDAIRATGTVRIGREP